MLFIEDNDISGCYFYLVNSHYCLVSRSALIQLLQLVKCLLYYLVSSWLINLKELL